MSTVIRTFGLLVCLAASITAAAGIAADSRPNIVLFLADDLGYGELGCYGNAAAITPNLDRFAAEGLRLTDCHSACPVCSPSRAAILTGRHPYRTGVFTWIPEGSPIHLRSSEVALPEMLRAVGLEPPAGVKLDGVNLLPALAGEAVERPAPMYWR